MDQEFLAALVVHFEKFPVNERLAGLGTFASVLLKEVSPMNRLLFVEQLKIQTGTGAPSDPLKIN